MARTPVPHKLPATPLKCCLQGDVRKADDCARWAEETARHFGGVDILVNCAAGNFLAAAEALSPNGFRTGGAAWCPQLFSVVCSSAVRVRVIAAERSATHCSSLHASIVSGLHRSAPEPLHDLLLYCHMASRTWWGAGYLISLGEGKGNRRVQRPHVPLLAVMEIDTLGTFQMSRAAHPHLKRRGGGVVVNISATLHYGATFYQVECLMQRLNALRVQGFWRPFLSRTALQKKNVRHQLAPSCLRSRLAQVVQRHKHRCLVFNKVPMCWCPE